MGRYGGLKGFHSAPAIMGVIGKGRTARYLGVTGILIPLAVSFYYTFIAAWCLGYFWAYVTGGMTIDPSMAVVDQTAASTQFYNDFTGTAGNGLIFGAGSIPTIVFWVITFAVNVFLILRGISKGIEKFVSFAMPIMAVCAAIVLVRVLTLGTPDPSVPDQNVMAGLAYMWNPDFAALANPQTWLAAAGQIFFSISVGFGIIINYASYMKRNDDVALSGLTAAATNEFFEVGFGGLITLTASFVFLGLSGTIAAVATGTFGLGFQTLPVVFAQMGGFGPLIGAIWFFMLFLAAVTSSISMYQPAVAFLQEALGVERRRGTLWMVAICLIGSFMVIFFTEGRRLLEHDRLLGRHLPDPRHGHDRDHLLQLDLRTGHRLEGDSPRRPDPDSDDLPLHHEVRVAGLSADRDGRVLRHQPSPPPWLRSWSSRWPSWPGC